MGQFVRMMVATKETNQNLPEIINGALRTKYEDSMDRYAVLSEEGAQNVADMASFVVKSMVKGDKATVKEGEIAVKVALKGIEEVFETHSAEVKTWMGFLEHAVCPFFGAMNAKQAQEVTQELLLASPAEKDLDDNVWESLQTVVEAGNAVAKKSNAKKKKRLEDNSDGDSDEEEDDEPVSAPPSSKKSIAIRTKSDFKKPRRAATKPIPKEVEEDDGEEDSEDEVRRLEGEGSDAGELEPGEDAGGDMDMQQDDQDSEDDKSGSEGEEEEETEDEPMSQPAPQRAIRSKKGFRF